MDLEDKTQQESIKTLKFIRNKELNRSQGNLAIQKRAAQIEKLYQELEQKKIELLNQQYNKIKSTLHSKYI